MQQSTNLKIYKFLVKINTHANLFQMVKKQKIEYYKLTRFVDFFVKSNQVIFTLST